MSRKIKDFWSWSISVIDSQGNVIDIDDEFNQNYGMISDDISNAVVELMKKHYKHNKLRLKIRP